MTSISPNLNIMIKACEKASKTLIRDFGELEKLQVSLKGHNNFVTNADNKVEKILIEEFLEGEVFDEMIESLTLQAQEESLSNLK